MKVLIDISDELFNRIKEVNKGSSLSNFVLVAIENQISLEKEQNASLDHITEPFRQPEKVPDKKQPYLTPLKQEKEKVEILNNPISYERINPVSLVKPIENKYIWGQYNKFFALKFAVRYLAFMQSKYDGAPVSLNEYQKKCSRQAALMKNILIESDEKAERKWGESFAAGLPNDEEKSLSRFIHHFIGYLDSKGNSVGALSDFGFIVMSNNQITVSVFGLEFARLKNPILDQDPFSKDLFSQEEHRFLIDHIKNNIPIEWQGMKTVLTWIKSGTNTPETLNAKFSSMDLKWTEKMANTYRTGMLARMSDLGFISRKKIGVNASYVATEYGKKVVGIT